MTQDAAFDLGKIGYAGAMAAAEGWANLLNKGKQYPYEEVEAAFHDYAARANMNDWHHWCDIFTEASQSETLSVPAAIVAALAPTSNPLNVCVPFLNARRNGPL